MQILSELQRLFRMLEQRFGMYVRPHTKTTQKSGAKAYLFLENLETKPFTVNIAAGGTCFQVVILNFEEKKNSSAEKMSHESLLLGL